MDNETPKNIWFTRDLQHVFLIPERAVLIPGMDEIHDMRDNRRLVSVTDLSAYTCSREAAKEHLYAAWQMSLNATKQAWLDLYGFSQQTGEAIDTDELGRQFKEGLEMAGPQAQEIFSAGQGIVESVMEAAQSEHTRPQSEQKELFKHVFSQLPALLDQFSEDKLDAAAQDPDVWAEQLYRMVFEEADKEKHARRKEKLAADVRESIAKGLRSAGMKPTMDWGASHDDKQ